MKKKLNGQILYSESVDDRDTMYSSTRAKPILNIMLGGYFTTWAFSLIYLVSPKVSADFSQKLSMVLLYIGLASALRNSAFFRGYRGKLVSLGLLLAALSDVSYRLVNAVQLKLSLGDFWLEDLLSVLILLLSIFNIVLVFGRGLFSVDVNDK
ncbi:hypothetical protein [uncultured Corynebacterium sp.]|uniref:hypothetical protein n=1 Tax=uncultured Corynebacterium sp. TaxID=159447 RepID=UPI0025ED1DFF|nr:hypothetical protein [uncultured Corynebacterium sp.]